MRIRLTTEAVEALEKLDTPVQKRILDKLEWFAEQPDPLVFAKPLTGSHGDYRLRVGMYRIFIRPDGTVLVVLRIKKRSEAYR